MNKVLWFPILGLVGMLTLVPEAQGQYIGFVYPAGGQRGTTAQVQLGGQRLIGCQGAVVSGEGVSCKLTKYYRKLSNQEVSLLREQSRDLKQQLAKKTRANAKNRSRNKSNSKSRSPSKSSRKPTLTAEDRQAQVFIKRIDYRIGHWVNRPACAALAEIANVEVTIDADAKPGKREIRLITERGLTNPMVFYVGQVPEVARKAMITATLQVLGKEALAQRKRPDEEVESQVTLPCTMNGQIASGEVNHYRFSARKGQNLVITVAARDLVPYIADAVPGWFQPVVSLFDAQGKEVAFSDDFRFKPDPTFYYQVPDDGEYVLKITDAIYRGREDFVYRVTISELPFLTGIFPLGGRAGALPSIEMDGWNLKGAKLGSLPKDAPPGTYFVQADQGGEVSNAMPFVVDTLPECFDEEANDDRAQNNDRAHAQKVTMPVIVNGRADRPDDWDVFAIEGKAGEKVVAEVHARRLDSPMDSMLKITDANGKVLAFNDDHEDVGSGLNTHHADSYLMMELPEDGVYYVHLGETTRRGGKDYAYRLRISAPRPDFALRLVPAQALFRSNGSAAVSVYAIRKDGFDGNIKLALKDPPEGFTTSKVTLPNDKDVIRLGMRAKRRGTGELLTLVVEGSASVGETKIERSAVPCEDRMQAFLWRHLVPAEQFVAYLHNPANKPKPDRIPPPLPESMKTVDPDAKPKFSKRQVAGRLRQLKYLYEEWLLTDNFYNRKVAECQAAL